MTAYSRAAQPLVTDLDIESAQVVLDAVVAQAKSEGLTFRTSPEWAQALSRVASLRRLREWQQRNSLYVR